MIFKTYNLYKNLDSRTEEENKRTEVEENRKKCLAELLWKSYCNNNKLWSLLTLTDIERKKYGIPHN